MRLNISTLLLFAIATAFYPRVLSSMGAPPLVNFVHFLMVPLISGIAVLQTRTKDPQQISLTKAIAFGLFALLIATVTSTLFNAAGFSNFLLEFLLLGEPLMLLLALTSISMSGQSIDRFRKWLIIFAVSNLVLALAQNYLFNFKALRPIAGDDLIQGVFYFSGAGQVVSAAVSMTFGVYYFATAKTRPLWLRIGVFLASVLQIVVADSKQVFLVFSIAFLILILSRLENIKKVVLYSIAIVILAIAFNWLIHSDFYENKEILYWLDHPNKVQEGWELKQSGVSIIHSFYESPLNWLLGLGPGHTVGRLGGWMLKDYAALLKPLGVTQSPVSDAVWAAVSASPVGDKSSMYSPFVGWVGIWGDLGFLGLGAYVFVCYIIWRYFCLDDFSRFIMLTIVVFGAIFTQMEEPGYMLFVISLIAIRWQEHQSRLRVKRYQNSQSRSLLHSQTLEPLVD